MLRKILSLLPVMAVSATLATLPPALAAATAVPAAGTTADAAAGDYLLGPGDTVKVTVLENPDLGSEVRVRQNGEIRLPLLEQVKVGGLTVEQLEDLVRQKLRDGNFVKDARVLATITEYRSRRVAALGFVAKPGIYALDRPTHVSDLLALAGGLQAQGADTVIVQHGDGSQRHPLAIDITQALVDGHNDQDVLLQAGDTLFVPKAPEYFVQGEITHAGAYRVEHSLTVQQALANAGGVGPRGCERRVLVKRRAGARIDERAAQLDEAVQADDVLSVQPCLLYIYGEVQHPGPYRLEDGTTLQQALVIGGGATIRGNIKSFRVHRRGPDGKSVDLDDVGPGDSVQADDVIYVKERLF